MKQLNEYLSAKIKNINSLSSYKANYETIETILEYFLCFNNLTETQKEKLIEVKEFINDWLVSNGIDKYIDEIKDKDIPKFIVVCDGSTWQNLIRAYSARSNKKIYNMLATKYETFDEAVILSSREWSHKENEEEFREFNCSIWTTESMIVCETEFGRIYVWPNKDFFKKLDELKKS